MNRVLEQKKAQNQDNDRHYSSPFLTKDKFLTYAIYRAKKIPVKINMIK